MQDPADPLIAGLQRLLQARTGCVVRCVQTHLSWVLLDGEQAWKIKKPLRLGFVDFTTLQARRQACEDELRLNRRLAASVYRAVEPITGSVAAPRLGGGGEAIEYALRMRQFADHALLSTRLAAGLLDAGLIDRLAARLAAFHMAIPAADAASGFGTPERIEATTAQVLAGLHARVQAQTLDPLRAWCEAQGRRLRQRFAARKLQGWVREGHGDLHLGNLVDLGDEVTAFDCIEFDPGLRWIDVQSDIAFLLMDLTAHGRADLAWRFLDRWLGITGDYAGVRVLRYYSVYRALVRALVAELRRAEGLTVDGPDYLATAQRLGAAADARLLITYGPSGSGKSVVSQQLLQAAGAIRLRSDVERQRLFVRQGRGAPLPQAALYSAQASRRTYARMRRLAHVLLGAGCRVIVDATFLQPAERDAFARLAQRLAVPWSILHCHAPPDVLRERVSRRHARGDDASQADLTVLEQQLVQAGALRADEVRASITVDTARPYDIADIARRWMRQSVRHLR